MTMAPNFSSRGRLSEARCRSRQGRLIRVRFRVRVRVGVRVRVRVEVRRCRSRQGRLITKGFLEVLGYSDFRELLKDFLVHCLILIENKVA